CVCARRYGSPGLNVPLIEIPEASVVASQVFLRSSTTPTSFSHKTQRKLIGGTRGTRRPVDCTLSALARITHSFPELAGVL
ncbi:hypothetical protein NQZ68_039160, partial [Dissostichus eleginoides]